MNIIENGKRRIQNNSLSYTENEKYDYNIKIEDL